MRIIFKLLFPCFLALVFFNANAQTARNINIVVIDDNNSYLPGVELTFPNGTKAISQGNRKVPYKVQSGSQVINLVDSVQAKKEGYKTARIEFYVADDELVILMKSNQPQEIKDEHDIKLDALQNVSSHSSKTHRNIYHSQLEKKPINKARTISTTILYNNSPIAHAKVVYHELDFETNDSGKVKLPLIAAEDLKLYIEGYKVVSNKLVGDEIVIKTELLNNKQVYVQKLSLAAIEIEKEEEQFEHTNERLTSQIEEIVTKLKTDKTLSSPERKELQDYLQVLTHSMERNDAYYLKSKTKRDSLLESLRVLLLEKDAQNSYNLQKLKELEAKNKAEQEEFRREIMITGGIAVFLLLIAGGFIVLAGKLKKQKTEVEKQKEEITTLYTDISDNISAAKVIQNTILPTTEIIRKEISEAFVFYHPRDVVSGDFYWCHRDGNRFIIAAADCTGHGVAGAFMTFIGYKILNQVTRDNQGLSAGQILTLLNQELIESLNQYQSGKTNAGMDIALCVFEDGKNTVEFAGANNPLYVLRNGEILQTKADKQGIGGKQKIANFQFVNHEVEIQKGDKIFLFSDGYAGQIGGPSGNEKFMFNRFRDLLVKISTLPLEEREVELENTFQAWRGEYEQLDDLLVIGLTV